MLFTAATAAAETFEIGPDDDFAAAIGGLEAGDELVLGGGTYELSARLLVTLDGTQAAPIVIRAKEGEAPHLHRALEDRTSSTSRRPTQLCVALSSQVALPACASYLRLV